MLGLTGLENTFFFSQQCQQYQPTLKLRAVSVNTYLQSEFECALAKYIYSFNAYLLSARPWRYLSSYIV